jgi:hypothetical protein
MYSTPKQYIKRTTLGGIGTKSEKAKYINMEEKRK